MWSVEGSGLVHLPNMVTDFRDMDLQEKGPQKYVYPPPVRTTQWSRFSSSLLTLLAKVSSLSFPLPTVAFRTVNGETKIHGRGAACLSRVKQLLEGRP
jgi:hypothetical protein